MNGRSLTAITLFCWGLVASLMSHAELSVQTDATRIHETDTFDIVVQAAGMNTGAPDFAPIERDFEILSTRSSSQYQSINGRVESWTRWTLTVKPRRTGRLTIPPLALDGSRSAPIEVNVRPLDERARAIIDETVFFEVEADPRPVYVQAQLLLTRRLLYADGAQLYGDIPAAPEIPDAIVQAVGDPRPMTGFREGRRYSIIEQRFAIFPERSGSMTIPPVTVTGSVRLPVDLGGRRRTGVRVRSERLDIEVLPIPADYPDDAPWLPARRVELLESWDASRRLTLGTPLQRSLLVRAEDTVASMIPPLEMALPDGVRRYPDPPELRDAVDDGTLVATRVETGSLVPSEPGPAVLPAVELVWFDTAAREVRRARLDARAIEVSGVPTADSTVPARPPVSSAPETTPVPIPTPSRPPVTQQQPTLTNVLGALLVLTVAGWALTWLRLRRLRRQNEPSAQSRLDLAADTLKSQVNEVLRAAEAGEAAGLKRALLAWGCARFRTPPDQIVSRLRTRAPEIARLVERLDRQLYASDSTPGNHQLDLNRQQMQALRAAVESRPSGESERSESLAPLYPP